MTVGGAFVASAARMKNVIVGMETNVSAVHQKSGLVADVTAAKEAVIGVMKKKVHDVKSCNICEQELCTNCLYMGFREDWAKACLGCLALCSSRLVEENNRHKEEKMQLSTEDNNLHEEVEKLKREIIDLRQKLS